MHYAKRCSAVLGSVALLLGLAGTAAAQEQGDFSLSARFGGAAPVGSLGDMAEAGPAAGVSLAYNFTEHWAFRVDGTFQFLQEKFSATSGIALGAPMDVVTIGGGFEVSFGAASDQDLPLSFRLHTGAGITTLDVDDSFFGPSFAPSAFDETYPSVYGGAEVGYDISPHVNIHVQGNFLLVFVDEEDTFVFTTATNGEVQPFETAWSIPVMAGIRITP